jgi:FtsP/CotA-like multicopper oxidase with cupredoxin domain
VVSQFNHRSDGYDALDATQGLERLDDRIEPLGFELVLEVLFETPQVFRTWLFLELRPSRYRFRFLNGCKGLFLILKFSDPTLTFWQIGTEGGFLQVPVQLDQLLTGMAEQAYGIVDFSRLPVGTQLYLINEGPDEPFGGGIPGTDFPQQLRAPPVR